MGIYRGPGGVGDAVNDASSEATLTVQARDAAIAAQNAAEAAQAAAETAETNAETAETNAETAATNSASSASSAATSASNASTSATNASNSASAASTSATNAANSASAASTSATNAANSATSASGSASTATTQATNASNSASAASTSATNASNSASAAATSATNAANSATSASGSATSASNSASGASTSASNAATSETNAAASASTATTQAGLASTSASNAATSETNAASSASAASTSASNASTSASNAATSESNAATSATNAAASYDSFDDRYLGPKSSAPTVDNDGNTLLVGALYFNTVSNFMKVWDGSSWLDAYASLSGALLAANNLSDLNNTTTARTNLGLGTAATTAATDYATAAQGSKADTALQPASIGVSVQAYDADLAAIAGLTPTNQYAIIGNGTSWTASALPSTGVTSVSGTSPVSSSGGTTPAISLASGYGDTQNPYASKTANYVLAAPNGTSGAPTFRAVVAADIPTLNQNTTGSSGSCTGNAATATKVNNALTAGTGISFSSGTTYDGSAAITINSSVTSPIPAGTVMLFYQASAPTGWTQVTTLNDYDLRLVSGTGGTTGGTTAYSTVFSNQTPSFTPSNGTLSVTSGSLSVSNGTLSVNAGSLAVSATTLTSTQMPSHGHRALSGGVGGPARGFGESGCTAMLGYIQASTAYYTTAASSGTALIESTGGGSSHTHGISGSPSLSGSVSLSGSPSLSGTVGGSVGALTLNVRYANIIICSKN